MGYQAVFITGAPAAGKSTLIRELTTLVTPLRAMEYGDRLLAYLQRTQPNLTHEDLRAQSSKLVPADTIAALDNALAEDLPSWLTETHVAIGSHAVTHEHYGVRVTAYTQRVLERLPLSAIIALHCPPQELVRRAAGKPEGRLWRGVEEADQLQRLQISLALQYGVICGCPVYIIDTIDDPTTLAGQVHTILTQAGIFGRNR